MEIDFELPSDGKEKLDSDKNAGLDVGESSNFNMLAEEEDVNSLDRSENILVAPQCDSGENVDFLNRSETSWENVNSLNGSEDIMVAPQHDSEENGACVMNQAETNSIVDVHHRFPRTAPRIGLEFQTKEAAYSFYREYARSVGFGITIKASRRSKKSGKFIDVKIACSRFGSKRESSSTVHPRPCIKTNCKAGMNMKRREDGIWIIYSVVNEHNHDIVPDDFYNSLRGTTKQAGALAYRKKGLQAVLNEEDTQVMLDHFMTMQQENPNFFYAIDLGCDKCLRSVFWVDAKGRHDYASFCDVVFFDIFYVKEKYNVPFLPVVGVNHHAQYLLLGCALIGDEEKSSYRWVMQAWLNAMGHQAPKVVITDQDKQLKEAVADVFPDTRHCFCLWHIFRKIPLTLAHVLDQYDKFMDNFNKCVYLSWMDEQFEKRWQKLIHKFEIGEDEWVCSLYEDRKKWVPTYLQDAFLAGMSTADRARSVTAFLDRYLNRGISFKEFLKQYKAYLQERYESEAAADAESQCKPPVLRSTSTFEKQMSTIYTNAVFKQFQDEVLGVELCHLQRENGNEPAAIFRVEDFRESQNFVVSWKEADSEIFCSCKSFEYRGFLCRHAMLVLQTSGVSSIPCPYILKRWTKNAKIRETDSEKSKGLLASRMQRFDDLCKQAVKLGELGSLSQKAYNIAFQALEEVSRQLSRVNSGWSVSDPSLVTVHQNAEAPEENHGNVVKSLKRKKICKKRKVAHFEQGGAAIRTQDNFHDMEQASSRTEGQDNRWISLQGMQHTESNFRTASLDGHDDAHQSMPGVGHLHSVSSRVFHCGTQQILPELGHSFGAQEIPGCFTIRSDFLNTGQPVGSMHLQFQGIALKNLPDKKLHR
ncbi:protein FAR1-RELATED SEQUENCE 2 [Rhodamnia argentea]|uniref:Protein FAR1-RELATED SEQUENCE n=1 Tax=Rhodamnia argentea TaxID=178133 RepID=A0A8B8Q9Y7_9MYRT|nr:protein FAR1-RELATED SEQUENCE 2 [Rhodamnia argentea]XP_030543940.1 protein FAR1-RELATED SEQUENCE 2 [Rhodamnia argentea]